MDVKLVISKKALKAALESNGEMIIGQTKQFFPSDKGDKTEPMLEFLFSDVFNEKGAMSVVICTLDGQAEELSTGYVMQGKKYVLAQRLIKFRKEGKDTL
jgi:hypothetical protein